MGEPSGVDFVRGHFDYARKGLLRLAAASGFADDADAVVKDAEARFEQMIPTMAYVDDPGAPMASSLFSCSAQLALYLALRDRGVDVHDFGRDLIAGFTAVFERRAAEAKAEAERPEATTEERDESAEGSWAEHREAKPGEFAFEMLQGDDTMDWGINITSCAICSHFAKYDAMDLVPYMCATDDVMSDAYGQGLRRSGTIALGAHQCDFRYQSGGEPLRVAEQYPQRIQIRTAPS